MIRKFRRAAGASRRRKIATAAVVSTVAAGALVASTAVGFPTPPQFSGWSGQPFQTVFDGHGPAVANAQQYWTANTGALAVDADHGVLAGDKGGPLQITSYTQPANGSLTLNPDGSFDYHAAAGFTGHDTFTYTVSNAVHVYTDHLPSLGTFGGVDLNAGGYGSSVYPDPGHPGYFYGLEDRGPNVTASDGNLVVPLPSYDPSIGLFHMVGNDAIRVRNIPLTGPQGQPYSGLIPTDRDTSDEGQAADVAGTLLGTDPNGYDSEGLVALPDGTFWVSDEYGPYITHFDQWGHQLQRLSPLNGTLPPELQYRVANKGMEGLTITPDGTELVGLMQSALNQPDLGSVKATTLVPTRIVTYNLRSHAIHEYLYLLHDPKQNKTANSEIAALSDHTFLVDERDGCFPGDPGLNPPAPGEAPTVCATTTSGASFKQLYEIDIRHATDIGPDAQVPGATYRSNGTGTLGLTFGSSHESIEETVAGDTTTSAALATLEGEHINPVTESLFLDINSVIGSVNPTYGFFSHDKMEGVAVLNGGKEIVVSNDSDFGITAATDTGNGGTTGPYLLQEKFSPVTGQEDNGEYLAIDMDRVSASNGVDKPNVSTNTVTINVHS